jgi:2-polyprenyl-3-methyl-5-hydroxy-6-metoxy-1,4-benzoquinol methylase
MNDSSQIDAFVKFGELADSWGKQYEEDGALTVHSANRFRARIVLTLLERINATRVLDVGCGSGEPLIAMLRQGYDAYGFDLAESMVTRAKENVAAAGFDAARVVQADMERPDLAHRDWPTLVALGSVYYARDFAQTLRALTEMMSPGGHFIFSLRNDLFSLFSLNGYTVDFFERALIPDAVPSELRARAGEWLRSRLAEGEVASRFQTVDDLKIRSRFDNPLTVQQDVLDPAGLRLEGLYFYHFHPLPPVFEHLEPEAFRRASASMENPVDWRGLFMASAFVVHARRPL